jgi:hypothetical protein
MLEEPDDTRSLVRNQAVATLECDVPAGWSLDDWRAARGLARDVTRERMTRSWRRRALAAIRPRDTRY